MKTDAADCTADSSPRNVLRNTRTDFHGIRISFPDETRGADSHQVLAFL